MKATIITDAQPPKFWYVSEYLASECRPNNGSITNDLIRLNVEQALSVGWAVVKDGVAFDEREVDKDSLAPGGSGTLVLPADDLAADSDFVLRYRPCSFEPLNGWQEA